MTTISDSDYFRRWIVFLLVLAGLVFWLKDDFHLLEHITAPGIGL